MPSPFFSDAFMRSFTGGILAGEQVRRERERLKREEEEAKLRGKLLDLQGEKFTYELQKDLRSQLLGEDVAKQLGALGTETVMPEAGPRAEHELETTQVGPRGQLAQSLARAGSIKEALTLFPELTRPDQEGQLADLKKVLGAVGLGGGGTGPAAVAEGPAPAAIVPGGQAAPPAPAAPPGGTIVGGTPALSLRPTINWSPEKGYSVSIAGQPTQFELKHQQLEDPPGSGQVRVQEIVWDPISSRVVSRYFIGGAGSPESVQRAAATLQQGYGIKPGDPRYGRALGQILMAQGLTGQEQNQMLAEIDAELRGSSAQQRPQPGAALVPPPAGGISGAISRAQKQRVEEAGQKAGAEAAATRTEKALSDADRLAIQTQNNILAQTGYLRGTFSRKEVEHFVGLLNRPSQQALLAARGVFGARGSERFAQFKAAAERLRATAFGEGGKQLTPFEASVVFGYTPTGREAGGATEFMAKLDNLERFTKLARETRLRLAQEPAGKQSPERFDELLREGMKKLGLQVGGEAGQTFDQAMIVEGPDRKRYRLEPGEKLPDGWQVLRPYPAGGR